MASATPVASCVTCDSSNVWRDSFVCGTWLIHMCHGVRDVYCLMCNTTPLIWWRDSFINQTWLIHICHNIREVCHFMCDMTPLYVWHDSIIYDMTLSHVGHASFIFTIMSMTSITRCVPWLLYTYDMIYSCMTWPIYSMTLLPVWHDSFTCGTWLIDMWHSVRDVYHLTFDMTPWHVWRDPVTRETLLIRMRQKSINGMRIQKNSPR